MSEKLLYKSAAVYPNFENKKYTAAEVRSLLSNYPTEQLIAAKFFLKTSRIPCNQNVQQCVHKDLPVFPVLNHINPNQTTSPSFVKTNFTDLLRSRHRFPLPILSSLIWLSWYHSVRITNSKVRNYSNLSKLLLLPLREKSIRSTTLFSYTLSLSSSMSCFST
jgi:hypothetical protein